METELANWHFAVAAAAFAIMGVVAHVVRAVFNLFPDKISDTAAVNIFVSDGYGWADHLFGTEYDDAGYYRLDSLKNIKLSVVFTVSGGMAVMLFSDGAAQGIAALIEMAGRFLVDLFWQRITELGGCWTGAQQSA